MTKLKLTEKEIKKLCEKAGCYCPPYEQILTEYADTPEYLRLYIKELGKKELIKQLIKDIKTTKEKNKALDYFKKKGVFKGLK